MIEKRLDTLTLSDLQLVKAFKIMQHHRTTPFLLLIHANAATETKH